MSTERSNVRPVSQIHRCLVEPYFKTCVQMLASATANDHCGSRSDSRRCALKGSRPVACETTRDRNRVAKAYSARHLEKNETAGILPREWSSDGISEGNPKSRAFWRQDGATPRQITLYAGCYRGTTTTSGRAGSF